MLLFDESKRFYKGNLHTHTTNSDGRKDPADVIDLYQTAGYDFLAITDHWKMTVEKPTFYKNMLLLPGIELDYSWIGQVIHIVAVALGRVGRESFLNAQVSIVALNYFLVVHNTLFFLNKKNAIKKFFLMTCFFEPHKLGVTSGCFTSWRELP